MSDIYVYYRVRTELAALMLPHVREMQKRLSDVYGVETMLKRRPEEKDGAQTWLRFIPRYPRIFSAHWSKRRLMRACRLKAGVISKFLWTCTNVPDCLCLETHTAMPAGVSGEPR
ncbi:MAG: DUF4936 family protein [Burkholderiaceae bacterium]